MSVWEKLITIITFLLFCSLIISSCLNEEGRQDAYYIISQNQPSVPISDPSEPPPPPMVFYGKLNFVIMDSGKIFFFTNYVDYKNCEDRDGVRPPFLRLFPNDIAEIKIDTLQDFLKKTYFGFNQADSAFSRNKIFSSNSINYYTTISSPKDTIRNKGLKIILDFLGEQKFDKYIIRAWTEEEKNVITTKEGRRVYDPNKIKWNVGFDSGCK